MPGGACVQFAIAKATDWNTPAVFANANLWPIVSEDLSEQIELIENNELGGCVEPGPSASGTHLVTGTVTRYLHYAGDELALAVGMGGTSFVGGTPNVLTINRVGDLNGLGVTLWIDKGVSTWRVDVAKVDVINISGGVGTGRMMVTYTIIGYAYPYNETVDWGTISQPAAEVNNHVLFRHLQYGINGQGDAAISFPADAVLLESMDLNITNALSADFRNQEYSEEPDRDGWGMVTGSITLGKYTSNTQVADYYNSAKVKQTWLFTGSGDYAFQVNSPGAVLTAPSTPVVGGPGRVGHDYTWQGERATAIPGGMSANDTEMVLNGIAADPLA
ncbi:MAG: phage tail tube protein [Planctomycetota bacterium]|jgi:hypothetical protein